MFVNFLNQQVGKGNWAMILTADHGPTTIPLESGAFQIDTSAFRTRSTSQFNNDNRRRTRDIKDRTTELG